VPDPSNNNGDERVGIFIGERLGSKVARANRMVQGRGGACPSRETGCEGQRTQV